MNQIEAIREDSRQHLAFLLKHYRKEMRPWMREHGRWLHTIMKQAVDDVCELEEGSLSLNLEGGFWATFKGSTFKSGFVEACIQRFTLPPDAKQTKGIKKPRQRSTFEAEFLLYKIREKLRRGWKLADILCHYACQIEQHIRDAVLWKKLAAAALASHGPPSLQELAFEAWLPLALWEDVSASELERRMRSAYAVCEAKGMQLPLWPGNQGGDPITALIKKTRFKLKHRHR